MATGAINRATAATGMNAGSSRSHSVFTVTVYQRNTVNNVQKTGKLILVDLAGSEMVKKTNATGQQLDEAKTINKSLSALGLVINALTDDKMTHVPYRDSKLTRVLQDSLGGNSKTVLIVACSPSAYNASETVSTLRFGARAKNIENKAKVNATRSAEELEVLLAKAEDNIEKLTLQVASLKSQLNMYLEKETAQLTNIVNNSVIDSATDKPLVSNESVDNSNDNEISANESTSPVIDIDDIPSVALNSNPSPSKASAAQTLLIQELEAKIESYAHQLEDEVSANASKQDEINSLTKLVLEKSKENNELNNKYQELIQSNQQAHVDRLEEKAKSQEQIAEFEGIISRLNFEKLEVESTIETLRTENIRMSTEIAEMSGNRGLISDEDRTSSNGVSVPASVTSDNLESKVDNTLGNDKQIIQNNNISDSNQQDGKEFDIFKSKESLESKLSEFTSFITDLELKTKGVSDASIKAIIGNMFGWIKKHRTEEFAWYEAMNIQAKDTTHNIHKLKKQLSDYEVQRQKLVLDLQDRVSSCIALEAEIEAMQEMNNNQIKEQSDSRIQSKMFSLQQRMEQLVAVHRQLLRKYASLELENKEFKKKLSIRDDRIKTMELNHKELVISTRAQAEAYVAEIKMSQAVLENMKQEYMKISASNKENKDANTRGLQRVDTQRTLRGGGGGMVKESPIKASDAPPVTATPTQTSRVFSSPNVNQISPAYSNTSTPNTSTNAMYVKRPSNSTGSTLNNPISSNGSNVSTANISSNSSASSYINMRAPPVPPTAYNDVTSSTSSNPGNVSSTPNSNPRNSISSWARFVGMGSN